jgi:hypothetical protein
VTHSGPRPVQRDTQQRKHPTTDGQAAHVWGARGAGRGARARGVRGTGARGAGARGAGHTRTAPRVLGPLLVLGVGDPHAEVAQVARGAGTRHGAAHAELSGRALCALLRAGQRGGRAEGAVGAQRGQAAENGGAGRVKHGP